MSTLIKIRNAKIIMEQIKDRKNTIIYGGAFNPPTVAHQAILQACVNHAETISADVWVMPSGNRSDKTIEVSRAKRLQMIQALAQDVVAGSVEIKIETSELDRIEQTETFDTVVDMDKAHPDRHFIWVFGSDSVVTMQDWQNGQWMFDNLSMLVIERPGTLIQKLGRYAMILPVNTTEISSTIVRDRMAAHESIKDLVTPSVLEVLAK
jgi:nicotinate-nucleotide adenylyltransferase